MSLLYSANLLTSMAFFFLFMNQLIISCGNNMKYTLSLPQFQPLSQSNDRCILLIVLSYNFLWSIWNGKDVENNSGQECTKSGTLPVTDKDLASMYVLCCLSPTCPWFWTERILLEQSEKGGKTKLRFKTGYDKTSTRCLNKKGWNIMVCKMAVSTWWKEYQI